MAASRLCHRFSLGVSAFPARQGEAILHSLTFSLSLFLSLFFSLASPLRFTRMLFRYPRRRWHVAWVRLTATSRTPTIADAPTCTLSRQTLFSMTAPIREDNFAPEFYSRPCCTAPTYTVVHLRRKIVKSRPFYQLWITRKKLQFITHLFCDTFATRSRQDL